MNTMAIGEKINNISNVFIVALPEGNDEYIKVSFIPVLCIDGTFYYADNTSKTEKSYDTLKSALTPEWAKQFIPGYQDGMKLTPVNGFFDYHQKFDADKANDHLFDKLRRLTKYDFYNSKW